MPLGNDTRRYKSLKIIPRDYQSEAVNSIFQYFTDHKKGNPVVVMPTGTGKSIVIAVFLKMVFDYYANQKILVLTHVKELIEQNYDKLVKVWPQAPAGINSSGLGKREYFNNIIFAGIASVHKSAFRFGHVDLIVIDEAHLVSPNADTMYRKFLSALQEINPAIRIIGLTATPYRIGQGLITDGTLFHDICFDISSLSAFNRLIEEGYLATLIPKPTQTKLNVDGVHMRGEDFIQKELQTAVDKDYLTEAAIRECLEVAYDRNCWLVFTTGIEHSIHACEMLNLLGISATVVHSNTKQYPLSNKERDQRIADFKSGKYRAIVGANIFTTGFDHPPIDLIVMLRPTMSPGLWVQMLGRGTRPWYAEGFDLSTINGRLEAIEASPKKNCLVMDFGQNTARIGPINDPVIPKRKGKGGGPAPVKLCKKSEGGCNTYIHASLRFCNVFDHEKGRICNKEFVFESKLYQSAGTEEIIKVDAPVVESFKVDHIIYSKHTKLNAPPSIKVSYFCKRKRFTEYVPIEHKGSANGLAKRWWKQRTDIFFPNSTEVALKLIDQLNTPTHIRVWTNKKYPEIMKACFDGSNFGNEPKNLNLKPTVKTETKKSVEIKLT